MNKINIVDASAALAYLQGESGSNVMDDALDQCPSWISAVNYCEIVSKLLEKGMPPPEARMVMQDFGADIIDFNQELASRAAALRNPTRAIDASLGDRACLALAQHATEKAIVPVVYTAEQSWSKLKWPFKIILIRHGHS